MIDRGRGALGERTDEGTIRVPRRKVPHTARQTLLEMHRRCGGSPAQREAGRLLMEHDAGARYILLCTPQAELGADKNLIDHYLETAGLLPIDAGTLREDT